MTVGTNEKEEEFELPPCKKCGSTWVIVAKCQDVPEEWLIICHKCNVQTSQQGDIKNVLKEWNKMQSTLAGKE